MINTRQPIKTVWNHSTAVQNDETTKKEHENKFADVANKIIGKTPKNEMKIVNEITDTKTPKESLQEWWKLSLDDKPMPDLSPSEIEILYDMFKGLEKEFENSSSKKIDNSLLSITSNPTKHFLFLEIKPQFSSDPELGPVRTYGGQKINVSLKDFHTFLGGFFLSQEQSFFAFTGNFNGLYIFPNMNGKTDDDIGRSLITRQGIQKPIGPEWTIGEDGVCSRYIEKAQVLDKNSEVKILTTERVEASAKKTIIQEASEKMKKTTNKPIKKAIRKKAIDLPVETSKKSLTPEESVKEWWEFSRGYGGNSNGMSLHKEMPTLSSSEIEKLYTMFKRIESKFAASDSKMIEDPLFKMKFQINDLILEFNVKHHFVQDKVVYTYGEENLSLRMGEFKKMFAGFILSLDTSFFAFVEGRSSFHILKNMNGNLNDIFKFSGEIPIFTRQGIKYITNRTHLCGLIANPPKSSEWRIGSDGVCRLVEENSKNELDPTEFSSIEEEEGVENELDPTEFNSIEEEEIVENDDTSNHCKCITM